MEFGPNFQLTQAVTVTPSVIAFGTIAVGATASQTVTICNTGVSDLTIGEGIEIHDAPETVVASIVVVKEVELEPQVEEGAEPEVVGEETPEGEGGEGEGGE